ncbi:MAG: hypothetical protein IT374_10055 [Polyangiaceae bacterium]|nr:hypothetical protein [Polyangiaceae bacterium]
MRRPLSLALVALALSACGGSSSETPFPQSVADMTSDPVLRRPRPEPSGAPSPSPRRGVRRPGGP